MNNQFFQQAEQFFKPISEIAALNARTFEALAEKQTSLMTGVWNDSINCAKELSDKRDVASFYSSQKSFWEGVNQKFSSTARDSYNLLTEAQEEMGKLVQDSISAVDIPSVAEPFMQSAYRAQEVAEETASRTQQAAQDTAATARQATQDTTAKAQQAAQDTTAKAQSAAQSASQNANKGASKAAQKAQSQTSKSANKGS